MATTGYAKIVNVRGAYNPECGVFALTSAELPGLFLAGKNLQSLHDDVPNVIRALYKLDCGMDVVVSKVEADDTSSKSKAKAKPNAEPSFIQFGRAFVATAQQTAAHKKLAHA